MRCTSMRQNRSKPTSHVVVQRKDRMWEFVKGWYQQRDSAGCLEMPSLKGNSLNGVFTINKAVAEDVNIRLKCEYCDHSFDMFEDVQRHVDEKHDFIIRVCDVCDRLYIEDRMKLHVAEKHRSALFREKFYDNNEEGDGMCSLNWSIYYRRNVLVPIIDEIDDQYKQQKGLMQKDMDGEDLYLYPLNMNISGDIMNRHSSMHVGMRCGLCGKTFKLKHHMQQHILIHMAAHVRKKKTRLLRRSSSGLSYPGVSGKSYRRKEK
ncbi:zinc finger protein 366 [Harpegnathos saltator]|uniref:zinc finger protein 366 n=1 Tax=Harpegnathos saltator TaxID=610380 RepID=UPI000590C64E|nr:zinc finger protein 366 [Harpegnathos saltator]